MCGISEICWNIIQVKIKRKSLQRFCGDFCLYREISIILRQNDGDKCKNEGDLIKI